MKIGVIFTGLTLDDMLADRFGRYPYFLVIDPDTMEFEALSNPNISLGGGASIQSAQLMADRDVAVVLTGNCGPNPIKTFGADGIQVISGFSGPVRQAVKQYISGTPVQTPVPNVDNSSAWR
jgi:predicted Fe-Mo cluster-binding NifX family protein